MTYTVTIDDPWLYLGSIALLTLSFAALLFAKSYYDYKKEHKA